MRAPIALSCGEPAGVGPEIALHAWDVLGDSLPCFYIGDPQHLPDTAPVVLIDSPEDAISASRRGVPVLRHDFPAAARPGQPDPENAQGVIDVIARGVELTQSGVASALCTLPIHKKALKDGADFAYPGHTEFLAALANVDRVVMMLASDALRVVPTTIHIAINEVPKQLTADLLTETIRITDAALRRDFGLSSPRLAVAGLDPHAGGGGAMGREEIDLINPVLVRLRAEGLHLDGPKSADTMFHAAARSHYDAAICMYHDQALIPIKTIDFAGGVNVTLGLPFIRTSPDHGTAFDIAGKGLADPTTTIAAVTLAKHMTVYRTRT